MKATLSTLALACLTILTTSPLADPYWCYDADDVWADVDGSTVTIYHNAAFYNCCPTTFEFEVTAQGDDFLVEEIEVLDEPCYCLCCYDLGVVIEDVSPGEHIFEFTWFDYETDSWPVWSLDVVVPDEGQPGEAHVGHVQMSGCLEYSDVEDPDDGEQEQGTWGSIKALYR